MPLTIATGYRTVATMNTWAKRIRDLQEAGMTLAQIGEKVDLATSTVSDIANERTAEPGGNAALKLDSLHRRKCGADASRALSA